MSTVTSLFCDTEAAMALFVASVYLAVNVVVSVALPAALSVSTDVTSAPFFQTVHCYPHTTNTLIALTRSALALSFADTFTSSTLRFVKLPSYPPVPI